MVTKVALINHLKTTDELDFKTENYINENWERMIDLSQKILSRFPSIGFLSQEKRVTAFLVACKVCQEKINNGEADNDLATLSVLYLALSHKPFLKAFTMFEIQVKKGAFRLRDFMEREGFDFACFWAKKINPDIRL